MHIGTHVQIRAGAPLVKQGLSLHETVLEAVCKTRQTARTRRALLIYLSYTHTPSLPDPRTPGI